MFQPKILLTGAHLTPALALQAELENHRFQVEYLSLNSPKLSRHELIKSCLSLLKLPYFIILAWRKIHQLKPLVVFSFGGYSAFPVCLAAKLKQIPLIIHEQTFGAGITSRLTAILADKVAVSWPQSLAYFPRRKTILTGNPIRREFLQMPPAATSSRPTIYITGGHQGSLAINQAVASIMPVLVKHYQVYHQFGLVQDQTSWPQFKDQHYVVKSWFEPKEIAQILAQDCLVISRSGINSITELSFLNRRAILIPLTTAQKNEQQINANFMKSLGLAIILPQAKLTPAVLQKTIHLAFKILPAKTKPKFDKDLIRQAATNLFNLVNQFAYVAET